MGNTLLHLHKWVTPKTNADLVQIGTDRFWFNADAPVMVQLDGRYYSNGIHLYLNGRNRYLPRIEPESGRRAYDFSNLLIWRFAKYLEGLDVNEYNNRLTIKKPLGARSLLSVFSVGRLRIWFSYDIPVGFSIDPDGETIIRDISKNNTMRRHISCIKESSTSFTEVNTDEFFNRFEQDVELSNIRGRMIWIQ